MGTPKISIKAEEAGFCISAGRMSNRGGNLACHHVGEIFRFIAKIRVKSVYVVAIMGSNRTTSFPRSQKIVGCDNMALLLLKASSSKLRWSRSVHVILL